MCIYNRASIPDLVQFDVLSLYNSSTSSVCHDISKAFPLYWPNHILHILKYVKLWFSDKPKACILKVTSLKHLCIYFVNKVQILTVRLINSICLLLYKLNVAFFSLQRESILDFIKLY